MMKYFRHLAYVAPVIKIFLCFMAGLGFEAVFFNQSRSKNPRTINVSLAIISSIMFGLFLILLFLAHNHVFTVNLLVGIVPAKHSFFRILLNEAVLSALLKKSALFVFLSSSFLAVLCIMKREKYFYPLVIFLLAIHGADIYGFKLSEIGFKTARLNGELYKITKFQSTPFVSRRDILLPHSNPRVELLNVLPIQYAAFFNWSTHAFIFYDELGNSFRTDHWLLPMDQYMRAYWRQLFRYL
jgi:hypothetical protein